MRPSEDTDALAFEICAKLRQCYDQVSTSYSPSGNIIGVFFHDLVIHFTGIIIHRNSVSDYGEPAEFPWIDKRYAIAPKTVEEGCFLPPSNTLGLKESIKSLRFLPVAVGQSIALGYGRQRHLDKILKIALAYPRWSRCFVPGCNAQICLKPCK